MAAFPALEACGGAPPGFVKVYAEAVNQLREMLHHNPPHQRPGRASGSMAGEAPPGLFVLPPEQCFVAESESKARHVVAALDLKFPKLAQQGGVALEAEVTGAIRHSLVLGGNARSWRRSQQTQMEQVAASLDDLGGKLKRMAAPAFNVKQVAGSIHVALMAALVDSMDWPDTDLPSLMLNGFPVRGCIKDSSVYTVVDPKEDLQVFLDREASVLSPKNNKAWRSALHKNQTRHGLEAMLDPEGEAYQTLHKLEEVTTQEVRDELLGHAMSPAELRRQFPDGYFRPMRRFAVPKGEHGVRPVDDAKTSLHNSCTRMSETVALPTPEWPVRCAAEFVNLAIMLAIAIPALALGLDDIAAAYRKVPSAEPGLTLISLFCVSRGAVRYFSVHGMNLGLISAVVNFCRVSRFMCAVATRFFSVVCTAYFDDYMIVDTVISAGSARRSLAFLHNLIGLPLARHKRQKMDVSQSVALGVRVDLSGVCMGEPFARLWPKPGRVESIMEILEGCRDRGRMLAVEALSLLGKLTFLLYACAGRIGRAALLPLVQRGNFNTSIMWTFSMTVMLRFLQVLFSPFFFRPRRFWLRSGNRGPPCLIYSDTSLDDEGAFLGICLFDPVTGVRRYATLRCPQWKMARMNHSSYCINQLELLGCLCAQLTFREWIQGRDVIAWCDNTSALSAQVFGYSGKADMAHLAALYHLAVVDSQSTVSISGFRRMLTLQMWLLARILRSGTFWQRWALRRFPWCFLLRNPGTRLLLATLLSKWWRRIYDSLGKKPRAHGVPSMLQW
jgi:hypothetical protein